VVGKSEIKRRARSNANQPANQQQATKKTQTETKIILVGLEELDHEKF
jgi:hypothetical protein